MMDVLDRYARENGFVVMLDNSAQNTPILFASTNIDVTQDIVRLYDQAYPVKGRPAASTTPATHPAQNPAAQPPAAKPPQRYLVVAPAVLANRPPTHPGASALCRRQHT